MSKRNLHILQDNKFFDLMISLIRENNLIEKNKLCIKLYKKDKKLKFIPSYENQEIIKSNYRLKTLVNGYDKIVFHSLCKHDLYELASFKKLNQLIYWRQWSSDTMEFINVAKIVKLGIIESPRLVTLNQKNPLYNWLLSLYNILIKTALRIKNIPYYLKIKKAIGKIDYVGNWNTFETDELKLYYFNFKAKQIYINYLLDYSSVSKEKINKFPLKVFIGHSGYPASNHVEIIDILSIINDIELKVFCSLSYGDDKYISEVINHGKEKLGNNFYPITEFLDSKSYFEFLNTFHVFIFNTQLPFGASNIHSTIRMGKKVYLRWDNPHSKYLLEKGIVIHNINDLKKNPTLIDRPMTVSEINNNVKIMCQLHNNEAIIESLMEIIN
jgi:hypothetical protein